MQFRNWDDFTRAMRKREAQLRPAFREGTTKATDRLHADSKKELREGVYDKPEDVTGFSYKKSGRGTGGEAFVTGKGGKRGRSKKGQKKWRRTGNLRRSEHKVILSDTEGLVYNDASYALPRHDLGLSPGHPEAMKGSKRKSTRIAPWRTRAIANTDEGRRQDYRDALWRGLTAN